jgi:glucose dehydrogenase
LPQPAVPPRATASARPSAAPSWPRERPAPWRPKYARLSKPEPQNWLMNHHDFGSHRYSTLDLINKTNVKNLKLAFAVPLGGSSGNEYVEATPLVEDGFMYVTDVWSVVYKIDVRSGTAGRIAWKMDPGTQKPDRNRGVALSGNYVISVTGLDGRVIATDKETEPARPARPRDHSGAARPERRHHRRRLRRRQRRARLDRLARSPDR